MKIYLSGDVIWLRPSEKWLHLQQAPSERLSLLLFTFWQSFLPVHSLPVFFVPSSSGQTLAVAAGAKPLHPKVSQFDALWAPSSSMSSIRQGFFFFFISFYLFAHAHFSNEKYWSKVCPKFATTAWQSSKAASGAFFCNSSSQSSKQDGNLFNNNGAAYLIGLPPAATGKSAKERHRKRKSILFYSACMHIKKLHFPILIIIANDPGIEEWLRFGMRITKRKEKRLLQIYFCLPVCTTKMDLLDSLPVSTLCLACPAGHPLATRCTNLVQPLYHSLLYSAILQWCMLLANEMRPGSTNSLTLLFFLVFLCSNNLTPNGLSLLAHNQTHNCAHTHTLGEHAPSETGTLPDRQIDGCI